MVDGSEEPVPSRHDKTERNIAHRNRDSTWKAYVVKTNKILTREKKNPSANKEAMQNLYLIRQGKSVSPGE